MPVTDIRKVKTTLRNRCKKRRMSMDSQKKSQYDRAIAEHFFALDCYQTEDCIFTYVSKELEVNTTEMIQTMLGQGKKVMVPRCVPNTRQMEFYRITHLDQLEKGSFGVLEPRTDSCEQVSDFSRGICIVPGLAFDREGYRLGYGKGYYDRFLSKFGGITVGICYADGVGYLLPHGYYDRPMHILITEKFVTYIAEDIPQKG